MSLWAWNAQITPSKIPFTIHPTPVEPRTRPDLDFDGDGVSGAAAHAAVDEAVAILRDGRARLHERIEKAAKDFVTEVDLASKPAMKRLIPVSTPEIGFYGEEGGGETLDSGRVWVADPLDGTIKYATGSPLCGVTLGLPFLGVRVDSGAEADVGSLGEAIVGMGDAYRRGGARLDAYLDLSMSVHRRALRFRCLGAASVLWTWLVSGQIHGMLLAHNNPYDVVAGHAIGRASGARAYSTASIADVLPEVLAGDR
jgi:myo-inositol-1(or 4)-monophosphatase